MKIPDPITVQFSCGDSSDLSGVIIAMKVHSGRKNPYEIFFPKTDACGKATLTREDFVGQFEDHWEMGLMDFDGSIDSANPVVEVSLFDPAWSAQNPKLVLAWPLFRHEQTKWSSRAQFYEYRISCRNSGFVASPSLVNLETTSDIQFKAALK